MEHLFQHSLCYAREPGGTFSMFSDLSTHVSALLNQGSSKHWRPLLITRCLAWATPCSNGVVEHSKHATRLRVVKAVGINPLEPCAREPGLMLLPAVRSVGRTSSAKPVVAEAPITNRFFGPTRTCLLIRTIQMCRTKELTRRESRIYL